MHCVKNLQAGGRDRQPRQQRSHATNTFHPAPARQSSGDIAKSRNVLPSKLPAPRQDTIILCLGIPQWTKNYISAPVSTAPSRELFNVDISDFPEDAFDGLPDGAVQTEGDVPEPLGYALLIYRQDFVLNPHHVLHGNMQARCSSAVVTKSKSIFYIRSNAGVALSPFRLERSVRRLHGGIPNVNALGDPIPDNVCCTPTPTCAVCAFSKYTTTQGAGFEPCCPYKIRDFTPGTICGKNGVTEAPYNLPTPPTPRPLPLQPRLRPRPYYNGADYADPDHSGPYYCTPAPPTSPGMTWFFPHCQYSAFFLLCLITSTLYRFAIRPGLLAEQFLHSKRTSPHLLLSFRLV